MLPDELREFHAAVQRIFGGLAAELDTKLMPIDSGYEVCSEIACIRIRPGIGHVFDVLGTIVPVEYKTLPLDETTREVGLRVAAEFCNPKIHDEEATNITEQVEREAGYARVCRSLFEGRTLWPELEKSVAERAASAAAAMRQRLSEIS
jgi:hypothetical protein